MCRFNKHKKKTAVAVFLIKTITSQTVMASRPPS